MGKGALDPDEISSPNCLSTDSVGLSFALSLSLCRFRSVALSLCRSVALSLCRSVWTDAADATRASQSISSIVQLVDVK